MKKSIIRTFCVVMFFIAMTGVAFAQQGSATQMLSTAYTEVKNNVAMIVNIASVVIGIVGIISLIVAYSKHTKGDPSSSDALMKVGFGLLIVIILMQVIRMTLLQ